MAKQNINVGTAANDKKGDSLRAAFQKVNANFTELYTALGIAADADLNLGNFVFESNTVRLTNANNDDSTATQIEIAQPVRIESDLTVGGDILPQTALGGDLGSSTLPWRSLYVSNNTIFIGGTAVGIDANGNLTTGGTVVGSTPAWNSITGKPTFATVATSGAYSDLTGRPTSFNSLVTGAYSVNLESGGVLRANVQGIVSDNQLAVEGSTLISIQTLDGPFLQLFNQGATKEINLVAWDGESLNYPTWSFDTDRTLTLPNDSSIKSATNIDITIDTPDSSTFNWRFGADGILTLPSVGKISNGAYDWTFGSTGITTFPGVINAGNINNLVVNDLGGGTSLTAGSQVQIGNSAGIAGAGVLIKNAVTNALGGETSLESGSKIQMDNGIVSLSSYTYSGLGGGDGLEARLVVEVDNNYLNNVVRIGTRTITTTGGSTINSFQGVTISQYGELTFPDNTVQSTAWTGFSVAADDSTQRLINAGEVVKFVGAGGVTTASDAEGNITITGSGGSLGNIFAVYNNTLVSSDSDAYINFDANNGNILALGTNDGAIVTISTDGGTSNFEFVADTGFGSIKFPDATVQTTAWTGIANALRSETGIYIDINLSDSTLRRWQFGEDGNLTFPDGTNYSGKDITLPQTLTGTLNKVSWNFSDAMIGNSTTSLEWNLLSSTFSEFLIGTSSAATPFYFNFDGSGQTLGTIDNGGIFGGGKLTFGSTAGNNAGDANAIELKATNGDVYLTSTESVKITVDASDSSARVWLFDPTGDLTFPDGTNQSTAYTGNAATVDITNTNGIDTNYSITFVENRDGAEILRADVDLTFNSATNLLTAGNVTTGILKINDGVHEQFQAKVDATGVVTHDCSSGHIFRHTSPDANWTANFTNLNLDSTYATSVTLIIAQGATGYYPSAVQIGGAAQTINWQGNVNPTVSTSRTDVVTFSIINNSGTYTVLGQLTGF